MKSMKLKGCEMKRVICLLALFSIIATPLYALNLFERIKYKEVRLGDETVLVNRITGKVEHKLVNKMYHPIPANKGWGGIPSERDMYQAQYERQVNR